MVEAAGVEPDISVENTQLTDSENASISENATISKSSVQITYKDFPELQNFQASPALAQHAEVLSHLYTSIVLKWCQSELSSVGESADTVCGLRRPSIRYRPYAHLAAWERSPRSRSPNFGDACWRDSNDCGGNSRVSEERTTSKSHGLSEMGGSGSPSSWCLVSSARKSTKGTISPLVLARSSAFI
jgi:hypothetical protein